MPEGKLPAPYYQDESVTIFHADCRDILPHLPKVDLVLTDPPYGIGYVHGAETGRRTTASRFNNMPIIGDDRPFDPSAWLAFSLVILWGANHYANKLPNSKGWLCWDKRDGSVVNDQSDCEFAWTSFLTSARLYHHTWDGFRRGPEQGIPRVHPTQKPIALMKWCLGFAPDSQTILDPFMGSGTTLVAAQSLGRKSIGIEIEERYCQIAVERLRQKPLPLTEPMGHDRLTVQGGLFDGTPTNRRDKTENLKGKQGQDSDGRGKAEAERNPQAALSRRQTDDPLEGYEWQGHMESQGQRFTVMEGRQVG